MWPYAISACANRRRSTAASANLDPKADVARFGPGLRCSSWASTQPISPVRLCPGIQPPTLPQCQTASKGLNSSQAALGSVHGVFLASRGVTGPKYVIEGPNGLAQAVDKPIRVDWDNMKLDCFDRLALKSYNTAVSGQAAVFCTIELHKGHPFDPAVVVSVEADVFQDAYDFMGGGRFGPKKNVPTKEDADHTLPYPLAVALLDGDVQPAQLESSRIAKPDVQDLLQKVTIRPDAGFTARYPAEVPSRVTVRLKSGESFTHEVSAYPGFSSRPFTWDEIEAKFDKLATDHTAAKSRRDIKDAVRSLESLQVADLMEPLGRVKAPSPQR